MPCSFLFMSSFSKGYRVELLLGDSFKRENGIRGKTFCPCVQISCLSRCPRCPFLYFTSPKQYSLPIVYCHLGGLTTQDLESLSLNPTLFSLSLLHSLLCVCDSINFETGSISGELGDRRTENSKVKGCEQIGDFLDNTNSVVLDSSTRRCLPALE